MFCRNSTFQFFARSLLSSQFFSSFFQTFEQVVILRDAIGRYIFITSTSFRFFFVSLLAKAGVVEVGTRSLAKKNLENLLYAKHKVCHLQRFNKKISRLWKHILTINPGGEGDGIASQELFSYFRDEFFSKKWKIIKHISFVFLLNEKSLQLLSCLPVCC